MSASKLARLLAKGLLVLLLAATALTAAWVADRSIPRDDYFVERKGRLVEVEADPLEPVRGGAGTARNILLESDTGLAVSLRILRPATWDAAMPVILLVGGHRTGRRAVDLLEEPGPLVVAAVDYPVDDTGLRSLADFLVHQRQVGRGLLDTPPALSLAVDWLTAQPWVDPERIEIAGVSFGAPFAAVAGAVDPRFRRVWIVHGAADNKRWIEHNLAPHIDQDWLRGPVARLLYLVAYGPSLRTEEWVARVSPRPVIVAGARDDERVPPELVRQLYEAAGEPRELVWTEGGHIGTHRTQVMADLVGLLRARMTGQLPEPRP